MIVNDKQLARVLDRQVKGGYELLVKDGDISICGGNWMLTGQMREVGRETLAVLVKHLGCIPEHICGRVFKTKEEYLMQGLAEEGFALMLASFDTGESMETAIYTGLRMGWPLYQLPDKRILAVEMMGAVPNVSGNTGNASGEASVCWMDDDSCVWFRAYRPDVTDERYAKWEALERIWWPEKKEGNHAE